MKASELHPKVVIASGSDFPEADEPDEPPSGLSLSKPVRNNPSEPVANECSRSPLQRYFSDVNSHVQSYRQWCLSATLVCKRSVLLYYGWATLKRINRPFHVSH
ncbi:MAG: hypothetical protein ACK4VN_12890 [Bacteroidales bacterium]